MTLFWERFEKNRTEVLHSQMLAEYLKMGVGGVLHFATEKISKDLKVSLRTTASMTPPYSYLCASLELAKHASKVISALEQKHEHTQKNRPKF